MENDINLFNIEPLSSLKPINSILKFTFKNQILIAVGYGNELRIYSETLQTLYDQMEYHDSHNIYGINYGIIDEIIVVYSIGKIVWYKIHFINSNETLSYNLENNIKLFKISEVNKYDFFLASANIEKDQWIIVSSTGNIEKFYLSDNVRPLLSFQELKISQCPTLYCVDLNIDFRLRKLNIIGGSAFSTVNIWVLNLDNNLIEEKQILKGHKGVIYDVKVSKDGGEIISCSDDRKIIVWEKSKNKNSDRFSLKYILLGHQATVWSIECFWKERLIASLSEDGSLFIWTINEKEISNLTFLNPINKFLRAHEGRGGRILHSLGFKKDEWIFLTGGEGGDLKIWRWSRKEKIDLDLKQNVSFIQTTLSPKIDFDNSSIEDWYQGVNLFNFNKLIGITRKGFFCFGTKIFQNDRFLWKIDKICQFENLIYSISALNNGYFSLGSSKGKVIHGMVDLETKKLIWKNEIMHLDWLENVTFINCTSFANNELYLVLTSCSKGIVGASISNKIKLLDNSIKWETETIEISGCAKYGELKCLDFILNGEKSGRIICGTVNGNIFQLAYKLELNDKPKVKIQLLNFIIGAHKGNVSSLMWLEDDQGLTFQSTGQDGKINQYLVKNKIELRWSHKWRNQCDYIVKSFKLKNNNNWLVIGALKHELFFFLTRNYVTSIPILIFKKKFGGIKRSFCLNMHHLEEDNLFEMFWCEKPSIKITQVKINDLLNNLSLYESFSPISIKNFLNLDPPSRLNYCCSWLNDYTIVVGGEDHIIRFYDISNDKKMELTCSIRLLDPIRKMKIIHIKNSISLLIVSGGREMLQIFEIIFTDRTKTKFRTLFSNINKKKKVNSRFISLDLLLFPKINEHNKSSECNLFVFLGSSKAELLVFSFCLTLKNNMLEILKENITVINLPFVPFSILLKDHFEKELFIGLSNGNIRVMEILFTESSFNKYSLELKDKHEIISHTSGVNSMIMIDGDLESSDRSFVVSSGHDQKISIFKTGDDKVLFSIKNAHFSSIRDLCFNPKKKVLLSISWDQKLNVYSFDTFNSIICEIKKFPISIWDPSKFLHLHITEIFNYLLQVVFLFQKIQSI